MRSGGRCGGSCIITLIHVLGADHAFLRLVNMLASLKCIMDDGLTVSPKFFHRCPCLTIFETKREMPVFGVIRDQVVVGIIVCIFFPLEVPKYSLLPGRDSSSSTTPDAVY